MNTTITIKSIVDSGLCIGCGLCEALAKNVTMQPDSNGSLRPSPLNGFNTEEENICVSACPGVRVVPENSNTPEADAIWGNYVTMQYAWATDAHTRFIAATGGVLTALGQYLINSKQVAFVYQVKADSKQPMQSRAVTSDTENHVLKAAGSRYAPVAPLSELNRALDRALPFAVIAKPCDLTAIENLAQHDSRINKLVKFRLTLVCGGQSTAQKAATVLEHHGIQESEVTLYRHRGHGNPGPTRIETTNGKTVEMTYQQLWADESGWCLEPRCKLCPDALGESADIAAADVWPGGSPTGEDDGFNGIIVRTEAGQQLVTDAKNAGYITLGDHITVDQFNDFQPHQVKKKQALKWRYAGLEQCGSVTIDAPYSRLDELGKAFPEAQRPQETQGTIERFTQQKKR